MILDYNNQYSSAQALTATADSTNIINHGADNNLGIGEPMALVIDLTVAAKSSDGNETYSAQLKTASDEAFSSPVSVGAAMTITRGDAIGTRYVQVLPPDTTMDQYSKVVYTLGGTNPTVTVDAFLIPLSHLQNNPLYADAVTIS